MSKLTVDVVAPSGQHAWGVREGWITTLRRRGELGQAYMPKPDEALHLLKHLYDNAADIVLLLGFDRHLSYLHMDERLRDAWRALPGYKVLLAQETVLQECYPNTREMTASALSCVDLAVFNTAADKPFYDRFDTPSFWQPFAYDERVFKPLCSIAERKPKAFFRGKHAPLAGPATYQRRRELLGLLIGKGVIDHLPFNPGLSVADLVGDFNQYQIALNLPAVFKGYTTRVFEAMGTGACLVTPRLDHPFEQALFESGRHLIHYDPDDAEGLIWLLQDLAHDADRIRTIASQGLEEVQAKHQIQHRWEQILQSLNQRDAMTEASSEVIAPRTTDITIKPLPIHFLTIVLNGEPFIRHHIEQFKQLPFPWHWHIVEGVADLRHDTAWCIKNGGRITDTLHSRGLSNDGTTAYLDEIASQYPANITIYRKEQGMFWDGKLEMVTEPLTRIQKACLLWQVDADELWSTEQICEAYALFQENPAKTAAYFFCRFYVGHDLVITTRNTYGNNRHYEWLRVWRYEPGDRWQSHEPPRLCRKNDAGQWIDLATVNPFMHAETEARKLVFEHYAYAMERQVTCKEEYYGYTGAVDAWQRLQQNKTFPVLLKNYFPWVHDEALVRPTAIGRLVREAKHVLWLRTDAIGDAVLAAGMLPFIRAYLPDARITVVCQEQAKGLYEYCPYIDGIFAFNRYKAYFNEAYRTDLLDKIRSLRADCVLNSVYSPNLVNELLAFAAKSPLLIGHYGDMSNISDEVRRANQQCYSYLIDSSGEERAELQRHCDFLAGLGIDPPTIEPQVWLGHDDETFAEEFLRSVGFVPEKTVVLFAVAKDKIRIYDWYGAALAPVCQEHGLKVIAVGIRDEYDFNQTQLDAIGVETRNLCGSLTLLQTAALIKRCVLAVGAETGTAHIACAVGTPQVIVIGGGHYGRFMPYSALTTLVCLPLSCYRCNWECSYTSNFCIKNLNHAVLTEAIRHALQSVHKRTSIQIVAQQSYPCSGMKGMPKIDNEVLKSGFVKTNVIRVFNAHTGA